MTRFVDINGLIAEVLPCFSKGTVYNKVSNGEIPYIKKGGRLVFDVEVIVNWMRTDGEEIIESRFNETPPRER